MSREKTRLFCPGTSDLNGMGKGLISISVKLTSQFFLIPLGTQLTLVAFLNTYMCMKGITLGWNARGIRQNYDAIFKLVLINHSEETRNSNTARKLLVLEANIQRYRKQKEQLINVNYTNRFFNRPKHGVPGIIIIKC